MIITKRAMSGEPSSVSATFGVGCSGYWLAASTQ